MSKKTSENTKSSRSARDQLIADLKLLVADAKSLTEATGDDSKEFLTNKAEVLREQLNESIGALRAQGEKFKEVAVDRTDEVEDCLRKNPWMSIGIAVVAGIVIDRLISR